MPSKNKYVAGWRTAYTTPPIDTISSHQPAAPSDKHETSTSPESPQDTQPPYPGMGKATIEVEPCPHLQALHADSVKKELESQREAYIRHMHCIQEDIERELSKGQTRGIYTDERKEWIGRRKFPYGYKPVYVKDPDGLYFPEHHDYTPLIFILDRQYDATEHAVRFIRGNTIDELYGWTNNGQLRVHITSSGDSHSARIRTLRNPSWHLQ